ncbi:NAD(P)-dependent oxidoreductase [Thalassospiraceae bacterium LMO-SO8]|nr:NAD(P)-dependent oxidoreductase [Alphaproteobacteria bacterium LMO-S08]WND77629.1 NAD(P)-dependent oxidoreductase [Thalassospiraceae bacterium LMO-SO8]
MTQTAIITGTSSFVGAHLARAFADAGYAVTATHSRPRDAYDGIRAQRLDFAAQSAGLAQLDVTDGTAVRALTGRVRPTVWVHHAGHAADYASPDYDAAMGRTVNVQPLEAIFAAMAETGGGVIITGSSAEYPPSGDANHEDDSGEPETPYGLSKRAETERARTLAARTGVPTRIGRLYIPFGMLDHPAKLLAQVIAGLRAGTPVDLSPCTQRRDFIGVADVCDGWLAMAHDLGRGGFDIFNICSGEATELRALLLAVADALRADDRLLRFGARPMRPGEPPISFGDNTKARRMLSWTPRALDRALREDLIQPSMSGAPS